MNQSVEKYAIKDVIHVLLSSHFSLLLSEKLCKAIEISDSTSGNIYVFWCWITLKESKSTFIFGQFKTDKNGITWNCKSTDYLKWAKKTYELGWFGTYSVINGQECWTERENVKSKIIDVYTF